MPAWTEEEDRLLRQLYEQHQGRPIPLAEFAASIGRPKSTVSRKARELGLTDRRRSDPAKAPPPPKGQLELFAIRSETAKKLWQDPEYRQRQSERVKAEMTPERRAIISEARKKHLAENGHPRGALGLKHSPETRQKLSEASRRGWDQMTEAARAAKSEKSTNTRLEKYGHAGPILPPGSQPYTRCRGGKREDLGGVYFRSAWEANYARYLNLLVEQGQILSWAYEADTFRFEGVKRNPHTYTPDFRVVEMDGRVIYHEVKGWMDSASRSRLKRMKKHYPEVSVVVIGQSEYREIERIAGAIPGWERKE